MGREYYTLPRMDETEILATEDNLDVARGLTAKLCEGENYPSWLPLRLQDDND